MEGLTETIRCWPFVRLALPSTHGSVQMSNDNNESVDQGSGWGWGWLSEAAKVAKTAYESNVKPALESMEQATSEFGTKPYILSPSMELPLDSY